MGGSPRLGVRPSGGCGILSIQHLARFGVDAGAIRRHALLALTRHAKVLLNEVEQDLVCRERAKGPAAYSSTYTGDALPPEGCP